MRIIDKNILNVDHGVIVHQVNCKKVMGAGLAKAIREKWPNVYNVYQQSDLKLGSILIVPIEANLFVCNIYGQYDFGNSYQTGITYTNYAAVETALKTLSESYVSKYPTYFPYKIGCGLAGGDWSIYKRLIETYFPHAIICKI